jgi:hypothetical protein
MLLKVRLYYTEHGSHFQSAISYMSAKYTSETIFRDRDLVAFGKPRRGSTTQQHGFTMQRPQFNGHLDNDARVGGQSQ